MTADDFEICADELITAGLAIRAGRGRLERTAAGGSDLSVEAAMLLAALPSDRSTVGNYSLRSQLDLDDETYSGAKRELRAAGLIRVGVGYGGSIGRAAALPEEKEAPQLDNNQVARESELYGPFVEWLQSSRQDQDLAFARARTTATPRGYRRGGGRWSRPDVTAVQVFRYDWLPEITVEVSTYEIKRFVDAERLESIYEAAAHGRWAHRASLVVEFVGDGPMVQPAIYDEIRRFRLGLYGMRRRVDGTFDVREQIKPPLTPECQPEDLNDLLAYFLGESRAMRQDYLRAIGR